MIKWYVAVMKKYVDFEGRARRAEFWYFLLANFIIGILLGIIDCAIQSNILSSLYSLAILLPCIAVAVRRLHDTDRSGWFYLLNLIPLVGTIILLVFFVQRGTAGPNRFGADPLAEPPKNIPVDSGVV